MVNKDYQQVNDHHHGKVRTLRWTRTWKMRHMWWQGRFLLHLQGKRAQPEQMRQLQRNGTKIALNPSYSHTPLTWYELKTSVMVATSRGPLAVSWWAFSRSCWDCPTSFRSAAASTFSANGNFESTSVLFHQTNLPLGDAGFDEAILNLPSLSAPALPQAPPFLLRHPGSSPLSWSLKWLVCRLTITCASRVCWWRGCVTLSTSNPIMHQALLCAFGRT